VKKVIKAGKLIDGKGGIPILNPLVFIEDNKITSISKAGEVSIPSDTELIDLGVKTILPGLIDSHIHYCLNGETNTEQMMLKESTPYQAIRAAEYAKRDLMAGFTTVRAVGDRGFIDVALKQAINAGYAIGPRVMTSGHMLTTTGGRDGFPIEVSYSDAMWVECDGPDGVARAARMQLKYDVDWVKLGVTGAVTLGSGLPGAQQFTEAEMRSAVECAAMYGKKVSGHAHSAAGVMAAIKAGVASIEHGLLINEEALQMMVDNGTYWVPTFAPVHNILEYGVARGIPQSMVDRTTPIADNHKKMFKRGLELGVKIVMGTDVGMPYNFHGDSANEIVLMVTNGMDKMAAIMSATSTAAEMLGWSSKIGTLDSGYFADIVATDGDPLEDITELKKIKFVMKDGVVYKNI
jgi:imidazolonepropionase-like amidohydrolase